MLLPDMEDVPRGVVRFTTNDESIRGDVKYIGDRTLMNLAKTDEIIFSTYDVKDPSFEIVDHSFKVQ